jgi:peptidoglycan hydrolase-like protein with peptidoglycan-binding domain
VATDTFAHLESHPGARPHRRKRVLIVVVVTIVVVVAAAAVVVLVWSGVALTGDATALAHVSVQPFGGSIEHVDAFGPDGHAIPISIDGGRLTPLRRLKPGEQVSVEVVVRRPGWLSWALGAERTEHLTLSTPVAQVSNRWMTVRPGDDVQVSFDRPVSAVAHGSFALSRPQTLTRATSTVSLGRQPATGSTRIAVAPRPWETVGPSTQVSWFPPSDKPVMVALPAAGSHITPASKLYITFSQPVSDVLGSTYPHLSPSTPGHWEKANSHTLAFVPAGMGAALGSHLHVQLPHSVAVTSGSGSGLQSTNQIEWIVPPGSTLRLHQLLAQAGYLPLDWHASGAEVEHSAAAEVQAAVDPPSGEFSWRYGNTPHQLKQMWSPTQATSVTKGAVMKFENNNDMTVDGEPGAAVWRKLIDDAIAGKRLSEAYSYVYVHREIPETATLWSAGRTVLSSAANTGISGAETELGTFAVFEHLPETTMSGTNPDGSHYEDPGIKWVSYFNGGDALHNFDRASFGTPQSLGCVELPLAASAEIYPYTPIGTLVTVET